MGKTIGYGGHLNSACGKMFLAFPNKTYSKEYYGLSMSLTHPINQNATVFHLFEYLDE